MTLLKVVEVFEMGNQGSEVERETKWRNYVGTMNNELGKLSKEIEVLEHRLDFILTPRESQTVDSVDPPEPGEAMPVSEFMNELYNIKEKLSDCWERVRVISERIDL